MGHTWIRTDRDIDLFTSGIVITPDGTRAYVVNDLSKTVSVIDTATNKAVATVADARAIDKHPTAESSAVCPRLCCASRFFDTLLKALNTASAVDKAKAVRQLQSLSKTVSFEQSVGVITKAQADQLLSTINLLIALLRS